MSSLLGLIASALGNLGGKNAALIAAGLLALALLTGSFMAGWKIKNLSCTAAMAEQARSAAIDKTAAIQRSIEEANRLRAIDDSIAFAAAKRQVRETTQQTRISTEVARHVSRPDYHDCVLDDCELCLANAAATGSDTAACPCPPHAALPAATAREPSH